MDKKICSICGLEMDYNEEFEVFYCHICDNEYSEDFDNKMIDRKLNK